MADHTTIIDKHEISSSQSSHEVLIVDNNFPFTSRLVDIAVDMGYSFC